MAISNYIPNSRISQSGVCTSTTRPASPYEGQVIYETDTDRVLVWNASAWVAPNSQTANPPGLELVKTQTVGTGVSSPIVVSGAFDSSYVNYKITYSGGVASQSINISCRLGAANASYFSVRAFNQPANGAFQGNGVNNTAEWPYFGQGSTNFAQINADVFMPNLAQQTTYHGVYNLGIGQFSEMGTTTGLLANTTAYTDFTLFFAGTLTGGTIRVYGYRN